jgi:hypothetical protein
MNKNQCPCKDCITLSICRAEWSELEQVFLIPVLRLRKKCSLVKEYIDGDKIEARSQEEYGRIAEIIEILKPPKPEDIF